PSTRCLLRGRRVAFLHDENALAARALFGRLRRRGAFRAPRDAARSENRREEERDPGRAAEARRSHVRHYTAQDTDADRGHQFGEHTHTVAPGRTRRIEMSSFGDKEV